MQCANDLGCPEPQFYPECAHLEVLNDKEGGSIPSEEYMVKIPGVWSMDRTYANGRVKSMQLMIGRTRDQYRHLRSRCLGKDGTLDRDTGCCKSLVLTTLPRYTTSRVHLYGLESRRSACRRSDGLSTPWNHDPVNRGFAHHNTAILCGAIG